MTKSDEGFRHAAVPDSGDGLAARKSDRTRQRILDSAAYVLRRKGFSGTRLSDIAAAAEMKTGSLYYHFASREELVEEVMATGVRRTFEAVSRRLAGMPESASYTERISAAIEAHLLMIVEQSDYASATIKLLGQVPPDIQKRQIANERKYGRLWRKLLAAAREAGEIRDDVNLSAIRMLLLGALNWSVEWHHPKDGPAEHIARDLAVMVLEGLQRRR